VQRTVTILSRPLIAAAFTAVTSANARRQGRYDERLDRHESQQDETAGHRDRVERENCEHEERKEAHHDEEKGHEESEGSVRPATATFGGGSANTGPPASAARFAAVLAARAKALEIPRRFAHLHGLTR